MTTGRGIDTAKLRVALRRMSRGDLLIIAERAAELVPRAKLPALVAGYLRLKDLTEAKSGAAPLLDEVRKFHAASLRGEYYESFAVNSKNFMETSEGTDAFIAELERLMAKWVCVAEKGHLALMCEAFDLLLKLLRRIDEGHDDVIFFADEGGSWTVGVNWRSTLPAYFRCLAETVSPTLQFDQPSATVVCRQLTGVRFADDGCQVPSDSHCFVLCRRRSRCAARAEQPGLGRLPAMHRIAACCPERTDVRCAPSWHRDVPQGTRAAHRGTSESRACPYLR